MAEYDPNSEFSNYSQRVSLQFLRFVYLANFKVPSIPYV